MKKIFIKMICVVATIFATTSCAVYKTSAPIIPIDGVANTYLEADLDYSSAKKVEGVVKTHTLFGFIQLTKNGHKYLKSTSLYHHVSDAESQALYRAKTDGQVDLIVNPEFEEEKHCYLFGAYRTSKVKVTGWGMNVKGIKQDTHLK